MDPKTGTTAISLSFSRREMTQVGENSLPEPQNRWPSSRVFLRDLRAGGTTKEGTKQTVTDLMSQGWSAVPHLSVGGSTSRHA